MPRFDRKTLMDRFQDMKRRRIPIAAQVMRKSRVEICRV
mgnify:CR=1 FL=1